MKVTSLHIEKFRNAILSCDAESVKQQLNTLQKARFSARSIVAFHDALLFLAAYPPDEYLYTSALSMLNDFGGRVKSAIRRKYYTSEQFINSGITGTEVHGSFTFPLLEMLNRNFPENIFLHSFDEEGEPLSETVRHFIPEIEFETIGRDYSNEELCESLFGKKAQLQKLISAMSDTKIPGLLRDQLFEKLKLYAGIRFNGAIPDRTTCRGPAGNVFYHSDIQKKAAASELISRALPSPENISPEEKSRIRIHAMCMLATLNRETDPVTSADTEKITVFHLERGITIALFSMEKERRMPLESYIGYMLYKNGIPMAYGGSWIFGNRALFGINIFEPFRGGESSLVILNLLRVYHNYFGVEAFSVEPYQFGKDNPEGIQSGAYWFYYKLGFRSDDKKIARTAEAEFNKMKKTPGYRSSSKTLISFTESMITLRLNADAELFPDPSLISSNFTWHIVNQFDGFRHKTFVRRNADSELSGKSWKLLYSMAGPRLADKLHNGALLDQLKDGDEREYNLKLLSLCADIQFIATH